MGVVLAEDTVSAFGGRLAGKRYRWVLATIASSLLWLIIGGVTLIFLI